ncbi:protein SCO1 homolog 2, mitochondrial [Camellia sinensis]|uniref:protein SCO1 homolog 2, mitochondrial n=1 Tax=Camellia sinensis TaxID=4442 RepID=UPI001035B733|nr:protein SCO1 homolog 2, mitochondrial [Camellia sinensis]
MALSRLLFSSFKNRFTALTLFRRFVPSKRIHCSSYMRSARRIEGPPVLAERTPSSHLWMPTAALLGGFGGVALFLYYNDEKRAILKGQGQNIDRCTIKGPIIGGPFTLIDTEGRSQCWIVSGQGQNIDRCTIKGPIIGGPFTLIDTEGRLVTERNLLGNSILLYFGYTSSPDVGPAEVQKMAKAIDILESKQNLKVLPVFVTIDPQRDTPSQLRAYLREFDSRIMGLTGSVPAIRQMAQEYRVYFKKVEEDGDDYLVESSHNMYLTNPNMEVVRCFGVEYSAEELSEAILKELTKPEHNRLTPVLCSSSSTG